jgi:hypothetical protein
MSRAAPDSRQHKMSELLLPYRHMPMLVLNSSNLQRDRRVNCCYSKDGGSNDKTCAREYLSCIQGCTDNTRVSIDQCLANSNDYNEVVLDTWKEGGWGSSTHLGIGRYVEALALDVRASNVTLGLALAVQNAAQRAGLPLAMLAFNCSNKVAPFAPYSLSLFI